ncbi:hypothetical protein CMI47_10965 [Candidatus Pacearchaeota archaeon]|nr:hypothetical protein [Candidatus Pacearchaeota archaeon]
MDWSWDDFLIQSAVCVNMSDRRFRGVWSALVQMKNLSIGTLCRELEICGLVDGFFPPFSSLLDQWLRTKLLSPSTPYYCGHVIRQEFENWPL